LLNNFYKSCGVSKPQDFFCNFHKYKRIKLEVTGYYFDYEGLKERIRFFKKKVFLFKNLIFNFLNLSNRKNPPTSFKTLFP